MANMRETHSCEWPDCDDRQTGFMRFCAHHGHMVLMGQEPDCGCGKGDQCIGDD